MTIPIARGHRPATIAAIAALAVVIGANGAWTQGQYQSEAEPSFRDPVTGRVYTPSNVGKDGQPVPPEDRAFEPSSQQQANVAAPPTVQTPAWRLIGPVPVTARPGSAVPVMTFDPTTLLPTNQGRWALDLAVANNSSQTINPRIECTFRNGPVAVQTVSLQLLNVPPGQRVMASVYGPESDKLFVDNVPCVAVGQ